MQFSPSIPAEFAAILAAGGTAPDQLPTLGWFTNSIFVALLVLGGVLAFARIATRRMELIPGAKQNFVELVVEFLYGQVEEVVGKQIAPKVFPLLATLFVFILVSNWSGLIPGVGTIGFGEKSGFLTIAAETGHGEDSGPILAVPEVPAAAPVEAHATPVEAEDHAAGGHGAHFVPLLRPPTADLNSTLGMAVVFMLVWVWITVREIGVWGFLVHTFGPKGGLTGVLKWLLVPIFLFVGVIEIISIMFRPISLSFRLFGNVYAGETLLHTMSELAKTLGLPEWTHFIMSVVLPIPFYFMEILVGLLQAVVFTLLCAVYVQLSISHEEEGH